MPKLIEQMTADQLLMACESSKIGTFAFDIDKNETRWNSVLRHLMGYNDVEEITLDRYLDQVDSGDVVIIRKRIDKILTGEVTEYVAEYRVTPIGSDKVMWVRATGRVYPGTHIMYGIIIDISEGKAQIKYLLDLLRNTESSKEQIQSFIEQIRVL
jgi:PAS domain S-box-containing protein